jgi:hypothetical protein
MTKPKDGSDVNDDNYIPVNEDKLSEEHKIELEKATEAYRRECLKSFSATMGEKSLRNSISRPHEVVGRPGWSTAHPMGPTDLPFVLWAVLWAHLSLARGVTFVMSVSCSGGPSNPCDDCWCFLWPIEYVFRKHTELPL